MCITLARPFCWYQQFWPWLLTYFWKKLNLGHNFWTKGDRAFILHMCIICGLTFMFVPKMLTLWPWPWLLTYFWKDLTLAITFEPREIGLSYYTCVLFVAWPFCWYQQFWPWLLTYFWKKLNLGHNFWTKGDRAFILHMCIICGLTFMFVPKMLTLWPWPWLLTYFWKNLTLAVTFEMKEIGLLY